MNDGFVYLSVYLLKMVFGDISTHFKNICMSVQDIYRSRTSILPVDANSVTTSGDKFYYCIYRSWHYPVFSHSNSH